MKLGELLYQRIYDELLAAIQSGQYKPGERLPTHDRIAADKGVSLTTVRQAIQMLENYGLVQRWPRRGTFVTARLIEMIGANLAGFSADIARDAKQIHVKILLTEQVQPEEWVQDVLAPVAKGDLVTHISRLHSVRDEPIMTSDYYLPFDVEVRELQESKDWPFFRAFLAKTHGILPVQAHAELQAIGADVRLAALLGIPVDSPVLYARKVTYNASGLPCECHTVHARTEAWRYRVNTSLASYASDGPQACFLAESENSRSRMP